MGTHELFTTVMSWLGALLGFAALACLPLVLLRRKEPAATVAWVLVLVFLPLVGVVLFWFFGNDRVRRPARDKAQARNEVESQLRALEMARTIPPGPNLRDDAGLMRLAAAVGRKSPVSGNELDFFVDAESTYAAQLEAIEAATDHVHLAFYIFGADATGRRFLQALIRACERGVRVRLLYDGFGSRGIGRRFLRPLSKAGGHVAAFLPLDPIRRASTVNFRNHRKVLIVDGHIGFMGGINIGDMFLPWRDLHMRVQGPAVHQLQEVFAGDWYFATRYHMADPCFFPKPPGRGSSVLQVIHSGPDQTTQNLHRLYFAAIATARHSVWIMTPYFVPDPGLRVALQTAAMRGVEVVLILPSRSNHGVTFHAGRSFYDELLQVGVSIRENRGEFSHAKAMVVDGRFATVGSANLDVRSFRLNFEVNAVIWDVASVSKLETIVARQMEESESVDLRRWRQRGVGFRLAEGFGRLLSPVL